MSPLPSRFFPPPPRSPSVRRLHNGREGSRFPRPRHAGARACTDAPVFGDGEQALRQNSGRKAANRSTAAAATTRVIHGRPTF